MEFLLLGLMLVVVIYMRAIYNRVGIYNRRTQPSATPKLYTTRAKTPRHATIRTQRAAYAVPECAHEVQCELRHIYFVYTNRTVHATVVMPRKGPRQEEQEAQDIITPETRRVGRSAPAFATS